MSAEKGINRYGKEIKAQAHNETEGGNVKEKSAADMESRSTAQGWCGLALSTRGSLRKKKGLRTL